MSDTITTEYNVDAAGTRLDMFLTGETGLTRSYIKQLIEGGCVVINGQPAVKSGTILKQGDKVLLSEPSRNLELIPQNIQLDIIYEDKHIAVINKQAGLTVHPAGGAVTDTLVNALMFHLKELSTINGVVRPGIVHRLDKDTTGVMAVAKTNEAHLSLSKQIADRQVKKIYHALVEGVVKEDSGEINTTIERSVRDRKKMTIGSEGSYGASGKGRTALSRFKVMRRFKEHTLVEFDIITGRTHQIRVHSKHIGHPVVGDKTYGFKKQRFNLDGQLLHAYSLRFTHPATGESVEFIAPLPERFKYILELIKNS